MDYQTRIAGYRSPDQSQYPELAGYSRREIYEDCMGGGALYLGAKMSRTMELQPGQIILDLGCGKGASSIFLARRYGVKVVALDLWVSATFLHSKFSQRSYRDQIFPLQLDITDELPFAEEYFDAIFCMNSLSFYGGSIDFLKHLLRHLKAGGLICIGMETLSDEFTSEQLRNPPAVYNYDLPDSGVNVWEDDFLKMHSPAWWEDLLDSSDLADVLHCRELEDAGILYEDLVLFNVEHGLDPDDVERSIAQIEHGRTDRPYKTLFILTARKRTAP